VGPEPAAKDLTENVSELTIIAARGADFRHPLVSKYLYERST